MLKRVILSLLAVLQLLLAPAQAWASPPVPVAALASASADLEHTAVTPVDLGAEARAQRQGWSVHADASAVFERLAYFSIPLTGAGKATAGGGGAVAYLSESRPGSLALSTPHNIAGDSIPFGVGVPTSATYSYQNQLDALTTGTLNKNAVSGSAWNLPAWTGSPGNPNPIPDKITTGSNYATNTASASGSVNGYNSVVVQGGATELQAWQSYIKSGVDSALGPLTQPWIYYLGPYAEAQGPGMARYASWRHLLTQLRTSYGARAYDLPRALQFRGSQDPTTLDFKNVDKWRGLPLSFRGMPSDGGDFVAFSNATLPTTWVTVNTATNTSAGIAAATDIASGLAADPANYAEGTMLQNLSTSGGIATDNIWRVGIVSGAKKWVKWDPLHLSRWAAGEWAQLTFDVLAAVQGSGAPVGSPAELFCAQDVSAGGSCGEIGYFGSAAPTTAALFDYSGNPIDTLSLSVGAPTNGVGAITVTRSSTGTLTEGEQLLQLQTTDGSGNVLHSPVDFRVGQPSTQTVPRLWLIPGTVGNESSAFTMQGRTAHGLDNGGKYWFLLWLKPVNIAADQQYVINFASSHSDSTSFFVSFTTSGNMSVQVRDTANTLIMNASVASVLANNTASWVLCDVDYTVTTPTLKCQWNKGGGSNNTVNTTTGSGTAGPYTTNLSKIQPRFFALADASINDENRGGSPIATRDQYTGSFGVVAFGNGNTGIGATPSIADGIWTASTGAPVARACGAAIGGQTPVFEIQGGIGDLLRGGCLWSTEPVFGTYRGIKGLSFLGESLGGLARRLAPANDNAVRLVLAA